MREVAHGDVHTPQFCLKPALPSPADSPAAGSQFEVGVASLVAGSRMALANTSSLSPEQEQLPPFSAATSPLLGFPQEAACRGGRWLGAA